MPENPITVVKVYHIIWEWYICVVQRRTWHETVTGKSRNLPLRTACRNKIFVEKVNKTKTWYFLWCFIDRICLQAGAGYDGSLWRSKHAWVEASSLNALKSCSYPSVSNQVLQFPAFKPELHEHVQITRTATVPCSFPALLKESLYFQF